MQELILCRGIPASGKSTWAKAWVQAGESRVRVNRDDLRLMMFGKFHGVNENLVTKVEDALILKALRAGQSVVVDDTNIKHEYVKRLAAIGHSCNVPVSVKQFDIELDVAIDRNRMRSERGGNFVPVDVIERMHQALKDSGPVDVSVPVADKYEPKPDSIPAIMVDIDGTLAQMGTRSPYEWHRVGEDTVVEAVREVVNLMDNAGYAVILMSGRDGSCRQQTVEWLLVNDIAFDRLYMRDAGDMRKDSVVKRELFDKHVRDEYDVLFVLDDRNQVVDMWRDLGLRVFQVAPGEF